MIADAGPDGSPSAAMPLAVHPAARGRGDPRGGRRQGARRRRRRKLAGRALHGHAALALRHVAGSGRHRLRGQRDLGAPIES